MATKKNKRHDKIAETIGASRVVRLKELRFAGPLDWLELAQTLPSRLISSGGRPSDPRWDTKRLVPFRRKTWKQLTKEAEILSTQGRKVGPAQLAAIVIEESLPVIESDIFKEPGRFQGVYQNSCTAACFDLNVPTTKPLSLSQFQFLVNYPNTGVYNE
jgi:hypothetical protein